ncbi:TetR/AcrR family transcriptional regulator [Sphingosinicella sp.]|uniref:TetR/AcrR family transcriptional regulator n=1 Tax=Sphingosinicella sp. TaxID=1917971 RepID=UPI0035B2D67F
MEGQKKAPGRKAALSRKEQAVETRARLKEATIRVLGRIGYRQMRIADVTREAGVAVGLFYHYFPDLKAVTSEVLSDYMAEMTAKARKVTPSDDLFETLREQYKILIGHFEEQPGLMRCMLQASEEIPEFGEIWKASNRQWTHSFARRLSEALGPEKLDRKTSLLMAYCLGSMSDGVVHEYYVQQNPDLVGCVDSRDQLAEALATLTYRAVFLANPPREKLGAAAAIAVAPIASR